MDSVLPYELIFSATEEIESFVYRVFVGILGETADIDGATIGNCHFILVFSLVFSLTPTRCLLKVLNETIIKNSKWVIV